MIVTERVQLRAAEIKESVFVSINNVVALALLEVDEIEDLRLEYFQSLRLLPLDRHRRR